MDYKISRSIFDDLVKFLPKKEIALIVGPRQSGKTTVMQMSESYLMRQGVKTLFLSLDFDYDREVFNSQMSFIRRLTLEFGDNYGVVFIDEVQRLVNAGLFLKGVYDRQLPWKMVVSGSGSLELKEKIHESLTGRKRVFELMPLSFEEFFMYKTGYAYTNMWDFAAVNKNAFFDIFNEYLSWGGYPRVVLEKSAREKQMILNEIVMSYLEKDISFLLGVRRPDVFSSLMKLVAGQIGQLINYSNLSSLLDISLPIVKKYLYYAEKTFVLYRVNPFHRNIAKEIVKAPKYYFIDTGMMHFLLNRNFSMTQQERGAAIENFVFRFLKERIGEKGFSLYFWRTQSGAEVDFIVEAGDEVIPIEVKLKWKDSMALPKGLSVFINKYRPKMAYVISENVSGDRHWKNCLIKFIAIWELGKLEF